MKLLDNKKNGGAILTTIIAGVAIAILGGWMMEAQDGIDKIPVANRWMWVGIGGGAIAVIGFIWLAATGRK